MRPLAQMMGLGVLLLVYVCSSANAAWDDRWYNKPRDFKQPCGEESTYQVFDEMCCDGKVFRRPYPVYGRSRHGCCSGKPYSKLPQNCCDGVLHKGGSYYYYLQCCGKESYDNRKHVCCEGKLFDRLNQLTKCCGRMICHPKPRWMPYNKWHRIVYSGRTTPRPTPPTKKVWYNVNGKLYEKYPYHLDPAYTAEGVRRKRLPRLGGGKLKSILG